MKKNIHKKMDQEINKEGRQDKNDAFKNEVYKWWLFAKPSPECKHKQVSYKTTYNKNSCFPHLEITKRGFAGHQQNNNNINQCPCKRNVEYST
ncbi:MAG TPA: hypothetical protein VL946_05970 [Lacibacter sp.]|nr:hypothetical protein [Lacibacter sp.]